MRRRGKKPNDLKWIRVKWPQSNCWQKLAASKFNSHLYPANIGGVRSYLHPPNVWVCEHVTWRVVCSANTSTHTSIDETVRMRPSRIEFNSNLTQAILALIQFISICDISCDCSALSARLAASVRDASVSSRFRCLPFSYWFNWLQRIAHHTLPFCH